MLNSLKLYGGSSLSNETFQYGNWNHVTDATFTGNLTYNDQNKTFYSSYGTVENGESVIHGIKIKASADSEGSASVKTARGRWYDNASGKVENTYPEAAVLAGGTKAGWAALKWLWNTLTANNVSTTNTFNANASRNIEKMGKAKGNMSGNRVVQQKQFDQVVNNLKLTKDQAYQLHKAIHGEGYDYPQILQVAKELFNK